MAAEDGKTAALVVALSAQITSFERDMKRAVTVADTRSREIETRFGRMNAAINTQLAAFSNVAISRLGTAGQLLSSFGRAGVGAAVGIGAAAFAVIGLVNATQKYIDELGRLKDAGETIGVTATQLKALERVGQDVGISGEEINTFLIRFVGNMEKLKEGGGDLFNALQKIDIELVKQFNAAKTTAEQVDVLADAYSRLNTESQKIELARAAGGRSGAQFGRLLTELTRIGGTTGATSAIPNFDRSARELDEMADKLVQIKKDTADIWGRMFAPEILSAQVFMAERMKNLALFVESLVNNVRELVQLWSSVPSVPQITVNRTSVNVPLPRDRPRAAIEASLTNAQELARLQQFVSIAGEAVRVSEQLALKTREINKAREEGKITDDQRLRAINAANLAAQVTIQQTREQLGIATEENIVATKRLQILQEAATKGLSAVEVQKALNISLKESKELADQLAVRQSFLPGLTQLAIDAADASKQLDQFAVSASRSLEEGLVGVITQTKSLSDAFREMVNSILRELTRLVIRQAVIAPLLALFGGGARPTFGGPGVAHSGGVIGSTTFPKRQVNPLVFAGAPHFQSGGVIGGNEVPIIAHRGEVIGWPHQMRQAYGGTTIGGSTVIVQGDASRRTVMLIESALARHDRMLPEKVHRITREGQSRRIR